MKGKPESAVPDFGNSDYFLEAHVTYGLIRIVT
jgi:hypothetical protein